MIVQKELFGEDRHVEFKAEIPKKHEKFLEDVIAFANTSGGKIIIGIEDGTNRVIGLGDKNPFKLSDAISNMIYDVCTPQIYTEISAKTIEDKTILEVEVFPGRNRPYYMKSMGKEASSFVRLNGTSRPASEFTLKELEMEGMHFSYDTMWEIGAHFDEAVANSLMESMYLTALERCRRSESKDVVRKLNLQKLENFGLLRREANELVPTRAFTLLTKPKESYVKIQCCLFKGRTKVDFIDRKEFKGAIQDQIEEAFQFVLRHTNKGAVIDGLYRQDVYELPVSSVREIITNAVLHRSYIDPACIQVSIFDDRIEVDSPGMLFAGLSVSDALSGKSKCRNKAIAEAFQYMNLVEGWGTGLPRLFRQCRNLCLPKPRFEECGDGIKVTVYRNLHGEINTVYESNKTDYGFNKTDIESNKTNYESNKADHESNNTGCVFSGESNNETNYLHGESLQTQILELLRMNPKISQRSLAQKTGVARSTIQRYFAAMAKEGILKRIGGTRGFWVITRRC